MSDLNHLTTTQKQQLITFINSTSCWGCSHTNYRAKVFLLSIGMTHDETYAMLAFFASRGGVCDCEIVMNCDFILSFAYVKPSSTIEHDMSSLDAIVVLLDHNLGSMQGVDILKNIKSLNPNIQVIILSAQVKMRVAITSLKFGAYDYVEKNDFAFDRIKTLIKSITKFNQIVKDTFNLDEKITIS